MMCRTVLSSAAADPGSDTFIQSWPDEARYSFLRPGWDAKRCSFLFDEHLHAGRLSQASRDLL